MLLTYKRRFGGTQLGWMGERSVPITSQLGYSSAKSLLRFQYASCTIKRNVFSSHCPDSRSRADVDSFLDDLLALDKISQILSRHPYSLWQWCLMKLSAQTKREKMMAAQVSGRGLLGTLVVCPTPDPAFLAAVHRLRPLKDQHASGKGRRQYHMTMYLTNTEYCPSHCGTFFRERSDT